MVILILINFQFFSNWMEYEFHNMNGIWRQIWTLMSHLQRHRKNVRTNGKLWWNTLAAKYDKIYSKVKKIDIFTYPFKSKFIALKISFESRTKWNSFWLIIKWKFNCVIYIYTTWHIIINFLLLDRLNGKMFEKITFC